MVRVGCSMVRVGCSIVRDRVWVFSKVRDGVQYGEGGVQYGEGWGLGI